MSWESMPVLGVASPAAALTRHLAASARLAWLRLASANASARLPSAPLFAAMGLQRRMLREV
eukprot:CAMPEP_0175191826 /NCGR_PEP_ID=MMETSP0093-20121207/5140_1 /TAXON_ID=311494 /ORGANISM="Alexandrium monilatum, Strain CCMP3105" /LENGTH=61 /DNA_ID=CAMNT_0016484657 /DNA_START=102 /DNA_END=287 /DNA_ORIENTATION=-